MKIPSPGRSRCRATLFLISILSLPLMAAPVELPSAFSGSWQVFGRAVVTPGKDSVTIANGYVADLNPRGDCEMSFRARAPMDAEVQIWGAVRVKDRNRRYVFALRGGTDNEVYLARYAPDGNAVYLGFAPLNFKLQPGEWYALRVAVAGKRIQIYLNDDVLPRLNVEDKDALWTDGGIALGGGWLPAEFRDLKVTPLAGDKLAAFNTVGDQTFQDPAPDKEAVRAAARAAYQPAKIAQLPDSRAEISLDGNWLFMPDQNLPGDAKPSAPGFGDDQWNVIAVPSFWTQGLAWLYSEPGFGQLKGIAQGKGIADSLSAEEKARVDAQTFDWKATNSGWYRHHLELPGQLSGHRLELNFEGIAKVSEVYVNGVKVGSHIGMFGEVRCDVTAAVKPGDNVIAVHVVGVPEKNKKDAGAVVGIAVTVEITNDMLRSLPHSFYNPSVSGIWEPVKLIVTAPELVSDVSVRPKLDGADFDVEVLNSSATPQSVDLGYRIVSKADGSVLTEQPKAASLAIPPSTAKSLTLSTPTVSPQLWSPSDPHLYNLELTVSTGGKIVDRFVQPFGFRTFTVEGNRLILNGKPFWLRGGDHFPTTLRPNDKDLAYRFMSLAKEGNVNSTRTVCGPMNDTWLTAADEVGMGISQEGPWPWLMLQGPPPSDYLLNVWRDEFSAMIRKGRNHPSVIMWTVANEMKFYQFDRNDNAMLGRKWKIVSDMIKTMRQLDPTRPIVADSAYIRRESQKGYDEVVKPNGLDDGDIDDAHRYYGWYEPSPFHLFAGEFGKTLGTPGRPLISQEMSTGYPRNDDHPTRSYLFQHYTPQSFVGDYAWENNDPAIFMSRQAFLTKEVAEALRRTNRQEAAGIIHLAYLTWFTNVWDAKTVQPKITAEKFKLALSPVLVSAELFGRHFYAGDTITRRVCLLNDANDDQAVPAGELGWEIRAGSNVLASGNMQTPRLDYYTNTWLNAEMKLPEKLPAPRVNAELVFTLTAGGKTVSENSCDIVLATQDWVQAGNPSGEAIRAFDPHGVAKETFDGLNVALNDSLDNLDPAKPLIIADLGAWMGAPGGAEKVKAFVEAGGRALILQAGAELPKLFPDQIKSFRKTAGEIVTSEIPESPVFDGIEPLDMAWFEMGPDQAPYACDGTYRIDDRRDDVSALAAECDVHGYLKKPQDVVNLSGAPLVEIRLGKGVVLASEMMLSAKKKDPIASRLLGNFIRFIVSDKTSTSGG